MRVNMGLYRGKRTDNGEWIEGYLYRISERLNPFIMLRNRYAESHEVLAETVGQYTGCDGYDFDKHVPYKIFDGDLCNVTEWCFDGSDIQHLCRVCFEHGSFVFKDVKSPEVTIPFFEASDFESDVELVGNICDNPELIGGQENA